MPTRDSERLVTAEGIEISNQSIISDLYHESRKLLEDASTGYTQRGGRGDHRESVVQSFLTRRLPTTVSHCKGSVQDSTGSRSSEFDILVYRPSYRLVIAHADSDRLVLPVESVVAAIEVRSKLNKKAIDDCSRKVIELGNLKRMYEYGCRVEDAIEAELARGISARESSPVHGVEAIPVYLIGFDSIGTERLFEAYSVQPSPPNAVLCVGEYLLAGQLGEHPAEVLPWQHYSLCTFTMLLAGHLFRADNPHLYPRLNDYFRIPTPDDSDSL